MAKGITRKTCLDGVEVKIISRAKTFDVIITIPKGTNFWQKRENNHCWIKFKTHQFHRASHKEIVLTAKNQPYDFSQLLKHFRKDFAIEDVVLSRCSQHSICQKNTQKSPDRSASGEIPTAQEILVFVPELAEVLGVVNAERVQFIPTTMQVTHIKGESVLPSEAKGPSAELVDLFVKICWQVEKYIVKYKQEFHKNVKNNKI